MQIIEEQTMPHEDILTGLCVGCAIRHHDFREILAHDEGNFPGAPLPAAWIDGRCHTVVTSIGTHGMACRECRRKVPSIYVPAD